MSASCQAHRGRRSAAAARRRSTATAAAATEATAAETADMDTPPPSMRTPPPKPPQLPRSRPVAAAPQLPVAAAPLQLPVVLPPARLAVDVATHRTGTEATSPLSPVLQVRSGEGSTAAPAAAAAPTPAEAAAAAQRASAPPLPWSPPQRPLSACAQDATHSGRHVCIYHKFFVNIHKYLFRRDDMCRSCISFFASPGRMSSCRLLRAGDR